MRGKITLCTPGVKFEIVLATGYSGLMQVKVLYFGLLRERFGAAEEDLYLPEASNVGELLRVLKARTSKTSTDGGAGGELEERLWRSLAVAVNREYVASGAELQDGDEVALLPPVSGGSKV